MHYLLLYFIAWFPMIVIAMINGGLREYTYQKWTGEKAGHQISTIILILLFGLYFIFLFKFYPINSMQEAINTGFMWLGLTIVFEFIMGLLNGESFSKMMADYNIFKGRLWPLVLVWVTVAPIVFYYLTYQRNLTSWNLY